MTTPFDTRCYYPMKLACSVAGLWPYQSQHRKIILQTFNIIIMFSFLPPQLNRLYHALGVDIDAVCMGIPPLFTILLNLAKNMTVVRFQAEIKSLLRQIETEWEAISEKAEDTILKDYASKTERFCTIYTVFMCNGLICYIIAPTVSPMLDIVSPRNETRMRYLGFDLDYGIDLQAYWFWLWLHTSVAGMIVILNYIAADTMYIILMLHGCYMFAIVRDKLMHVTDSKRKCAARSFDNCDCNTERNTCRCEERRSESQENATAMKECILSHKRAIECAQLLHCIYSNSLLVAATVNVIIISISAVQLLSKIFQWAEMVMSVVFIIGELTHIFFISLMAQFILDQSMDVHESAYSCCWHDMPTQIQKNIILILIRSRSPCKMTAGKVFVLSLESFCAILQTSMSYFTVLASFR